jgi:hypothetical protein
VISSTSPWAVGLGVTVALLAAALPASSGRAVAAAPMVGTLYSASAKAPAAPSPRSGPALDIGVDPAARALLPADDQVLVRFVPVEASTFTLTLARQRSESRPQPVGGRAAKTPKRARVQPAPTSPPATVPAPIATAAPAPQVAVAAPPPPAPTLPKTFTEIDEALRASSTTQAVNLRLKKAGIAFRLTHVGRVGDRYVLRYAIANEEPADFFLSIVNVAAGGKAIHSETAGPFSCPSGQEIFGVVHFAPSDAAGRAVSIELIQSGGDRRHFPLTVSYTF